MNRFHSISQNFSKNSKLYVESFLTGGICGDETKIIANELSSYGCEIIPIPRDDVVRRLSLTLNDMAVGTPEFICLVLSWMDLSIPVAPDYPRCLESYLHRNIKQSTLGECLKMFDKKPSTQIFIKPAFNAKAFNGEFLPNFDEALMWLNMWIDIHGENFPVWTSTPINILIEYRIYVVYGEIVGIGKYGKSAPEGCPHLDLEIVKQAVSILYASSESLDGCSMDFAIIKDGEIYCTALVELNDGIFTGFYEGVTYKNFTDMYCARWFQLISNNSLN